MNVASPICSFDLSIDVPDWLQACLNNDDPHHLVANLSSEEVDLVKRAFEFAYSLHEGQCRASGEPYIAHPVAVAGLLRELGGNGSTISAGFLHDVVEDTDVTPEDIEQRFGEEVRRLVEGVTKLSKFNFSSKTERQAENFRRMFLAMARDIRVIVVKLADRLHNMRTLHHLPPQKQKRIAQETLDIFAPLANRLGIGRFKWELEDLSFKYLDPESYQRIRELVADKRADRESRIQNVITTIETRLQQIGIPNFEISGRPKHLYGIFHKMQRQQKAFHEIYDIAALRIIVGSNDECYRALAVVHDAFSPIPGRFKDYIGLPKPNRYQSLHTGVIGRGGRPIEVQIRTYEMHHVAEYGIAAHWKYKESGSSQTQWTTEDEKFTWLRQLLEWQSDLKDAQEYLDSIKDNLFEDDVYVFTPNGDVISLKQGATPIDFAYRIHTEVGNHCAGAKVDGRIVPLDSLLINGSIVEIITQKNSHPSLDWLNFVVTPSARNRIRQWYKRSHRDENVARGREMLEKELGKSGFEALLKSEPMQDVTERCNYQTVEDLLAAVGYGEVTLNQVVNRLQDAVKARQTPTESEFSSSQMLSLSTGTVPDTQASKSPIAGVEGMVYHVAGCCKPVPGEPIIGVVTRSDRGISIHRQNCHNVESVPGDRLVPVSWNVCSQNGRPQTYPVDISIEVLDRVGVLNDILSRLKDNNINVHSAQVRTSEGKPAIIDLGIGIRDLAQLDRTFAQIRKMSDVLNMRRIGEGRS
ncbi:MAG: bifunctional (p)ppGpp synthetase/guanosine-3',5'-bis(diphosphate) 3'-pyrophosphohydrolase [Cyanobacteria bacterium SID2]|nr:bifunctional (p)ppGpp synthetase/guanosine-3',5'-bis(diphosphate) 3'-pyrophosphohydrolase [Cyanobacteria bacterium SID2]MBP0006831.1 bifunctional (p)ppGpp synthetase/guanosine-3',5'-bis(diphosphate) 3'-pyrophosphohydrolase [Cyanobacteria bacterium SBC]